MLAPIVTPTASLFINPRRLIMGYANRVQEDSKEPINTELNQSNPKIFPSKVPSTKGTQKIKLPKPKARFRRRLNCSKSTSRPATNNK